MNEKCSYEKEMFSDKTNSNKFYGYVKSQMKMKCAIPSLKKIDGSLSGTDQEKAEAFSVYFSSVLVEDNNILPEFHFDCQERLDQFNSDVRDVIKIVMKLKPSSSPGPDGFTAGFTKNILANVANPLCIVYNKSLTDGDVPIDWKLAYIIPIFNKGDQQKNFSVPTS